MCMQENWSVRTLRERKKSMLYERTAISKKPEETIKNEIAELRDDGKMSLDLFYRDPYMLDFLGLRDTYSEKDLRFWQCRSILCWMVKITIWIYCFITEV